jgi:hypothetical protein
MHSTGSGTLHRRHLSIHTRYDKEKLATLKPNADWYPPSIFFQGMKYMLFGDPALELPR